jgi:hypothetical protein
MKQKKKRGFEHDKVSLVVILLGTMFFFFSVTYFLGDGFTGADIVLMNYGIQEDATSTSCGDVNSSLTLSSNVSSTGICFTIANSSLNLDCAGYTVYYGADGKGNAVSNIGYDNVSVVNCVGIKNGSTGDENYGIYFQNATNGIIKNNTITTNGNVSNHGVTLNQSSNETIIKNNLINTNGTNRTNVGIFVEDSGWVNLTNNVIFTNGSAHNYGITVDEVDFKMFGIHIIDNNISTNGDNDDNYGMLLDLDFSNISGNNISTNGTKDNHGIDIRGPDNVIEKNTIFTFGFSVAEGLNENNVGIISSGSRNNISHNKIFTHGVEENYGIHLTATSALVYNNTITTNGTTSATSADNNDGIRTAGNSDDSHNITQNIITVGGANSIGIMLHSEENVVFNNTINDATDAPNKTYGIYLNDADNNNVSYNKIVTKGSEGYGIYVESTAFGNLLLNNNISSSNGYEIYDDTGSSLANELVFNNSFGEIRWGDQDLTVNLSYDGYFALGHDVLIGNNSVSVNSSQFNTGNINSSANITLYSVDIDSVTKIVKLDGVGNETEILVDGSQCSSAICSLISHDSTTRTALVNVSNFSSYSVTNESLTKTFTLSPENNTNFTANKTPSFIFNLDGDAPLYSCDIYIQNSSNDIDTAGVNSTTLDTVSTMITSNHSLETGENVWWVNCSDGINSISSNEHNITINPLCDEVIVSDLTLTESIRGENTCISIGASDLILDCAGYTITYGTDGTGYGVNNTGYDNVTVKNCNIQKTAVTGDSNYGIYFESALKGNITNNTITTNGVTFSHGVELNNSVNETIITSNTIYTNGSSSDNYGISITEGINNNLSFNTINTDGTSEAEGVALDSANYTLVFNNNISTFSPSGGNNDGVNFLLSYYNNISYNTIKTNGSGTFNRCFFLSTGGENLIDNNNCTTDGTDKNNYGIGLGESASPGNNITNNIISTNGTSDNVGIRINPNGLNRIEGNTIRTNGTTDDQYGIWFNSADGAEVIGNTITTGGIGDDSHGIFVQTGSDNNLIDSNIIYTQGEDVDNFGIYLKDADSANVTNNTILTSGSATYYGILLDSGSTNNILENNNISAGSEYEIFDSSSGVNELVYNNSFGHINWSSTELTINVTLEIGNTIILENNSIGVTDDEQRGNLSNQAQIIIYGLGYNATPFLMKDVERCDNESFCNISYNNETGVLIANISGFSLYETGDNLTDADGDGIIDILDTLRGNITQVTHSGFTNFNISIGGNRSNGTFGGRQPFIMYDDGKPTVNFTHNFSKKFFNLNRLRLDKQVRSFVVNMSGQLQSIEQKMMWLHTSGISSLCVKDAQIDSLDEISSSCDGNSELDFTGCIGVSTGYTNGSVICYDNETSFRFENLTHSGIRGSTTTTTAESSTTSSSSSGGSGVGYGFCGDFVCNDGEKCAPNNEINKHKSFCAHDCGVCEHDIFEEIKQKDTSKEDIEKLLEEVNADESVIQKIIQSPSKAISNFVGNSLLLSIGIGLGAVILFVIIIFMKRSSESIKNVFKRKRDKK